MAKKSGKPIKKPILQEEGQMFLGVDSQYIALMLYIGSSVVYFFQPSPFVPLVAWLLGLLTYQYCKQAFLSFHALQSAAINIIAVFLRFGIGYANSLLINQVIATGGDEALLLEKAQQMGWVSMGITVILLIIQIYGAETALRGLMKQIPIVHNIGQQMMIFFFGLSPEEE